jgi:hypothetical protein
MVSTHLTLSRTSRRDLEEGEETLPHPCTGGRRVPAVGLLRQHSTCVQDRLDPSQTLLESEHSQGHDLPA